MPAVTEKTTTLQSSGTIVDHFRCVQIPAFVLPGTLGPSRGFFRFGRDVMCYGQAAGQTSSASNGNLYDAEEHINSYGSTICLPFDLDQIVDNLRYERYVHSATDGWTQESWVKDAYYFLRPVLPVFIRKHLQKV